MIIPTQSSPPFWGFCTLKISVKYYPQKLQKIDTKILKINLVIFTPALKKKFRTHVIKLDIAPMSYPPGQYLLVSASNNMLYYLSQWDKIHTTCVVNLMSQDTKFWLFKINCVRIRTHNLQDDTLILYLCRLHRNRRYEDWGRASSLGRASS